MTRAETRRFASFVKFALLVAFLLLLGRPAFARGPDVIVTTDCGADVDDQFAIAYLSLIPEVHIKGIVTTHAPTLPKNAESSAACVADVLHRLGVSSPPPIFAGSNVPLDSRMPLRNAGVDFMLETSRDYSAKNRLVVITIGATTDVASAFLADPAFADRVEH
jgi:inosine-uridine nucleoside N-ribohydrolase